MKKTYIILLFVIALVGITNYFANTNNNPLPKGTTIDSLCVFKSKRVLQVFSNKKLMKTYEISLGLNPIGDKEFEGDRKTPEGIYSINDKNPNSHFHKNLGISYPNEKDIESAEQLGKPAGKDIKIHGLGTLRAPLGKLHLWMDWTSGCVAVTNTEIDELFEAVPIGTTIGIFP